MSGADGFFEWMVLRRVCAGGVWWAPGGYHDQGRALGGELARTLDRLLGSGHLVLGGQRPDGRRALRATVAGEIRVAELREVSRG